MKNVEEQVENTPLLDDEAVSDYLRQHPDFFMRNARQVEQMAVPHPVRGSVSLVEWHMARQRNHIQRLEEEITLLMEQATANQQLFARLLALQSHLAAASSLQDMLNRLHRWARELGLAGANIRLFNDKWRLGAPSDFVQLGLARARPLNRCAFSASVMNSTISAVLMAPNCCYCCPRRKPSARWPCH